MNRDIETIVDRVKERIPSTVVEQLKVSHPGADDDGLWYFSIPGAKRDIQIESPTGQCPFWVEHSDMKSSSEARTASTVDGAVEEIVKYLTIIMTKTKI